MFRTILVPLDGSPFAEQALPYALAVARRSGSALRLATAAPPLVDSTMEGLTFSAGELETELSDRCRSYLASAAARVRAAAPGVAVEADLLPGEVAESLVRHAADLHAGLVVMATHGRGAVERFWLGSVTDELVRRLERPLLLVRPGEGATDLAAEPPLGPVLAALDGSTHAESILEHAAALALLDPEPRMVLLRAIQPVAGFGGTPDVPEARREASQLLTRVQQMQAKVREDAEVYLEGAARKLHERGIKTRTVVLVGEQPAQAILDEAKTTGAGLIALETHGRAGLSWMLLSRGVADKVIRASSLPVLVHRLPA